MASSVIVNGGIPRPTRRERAARARRRRRIAFGSVLLALVLVAALATSAAGMLAWTVSRVSSALPTPAGSPPIAVPADDEDTPDSPSVPVEPAAPATPEDDTPPLVDDPAPREVDDEPPVVEDQPPVVEEPAAEEPVEDDEPTLTIGEVQERLRGYGFLIGAADGTAGQQTTAAIMAFQRVNGLSVDGVVGPATTAALLAGTVDPVLNGGPDDRIEIDLDRQLLHLVEAGARTATLQVSSGSGQVHELPRRGHRPHPGR
ncbi:MAG: peptidoglycan-binding domain-containing protein [Egicoccus sp.]